jgi:alpha-L-rhamnosidase
MSRFWKNTQWTQRANFIEMPTDCPQRDERLGWMGDAQIYVRTASYNADVAAFFTKWLDDVEEAQRDFGAYPDYCPYPMAHGQPGKTFGTAWTDAGIICPWTIWQVYGDTRVVERHWASMTRFMDWQKRNAPAGQGVSLGNTWGDWLNLGENTPIEFIDAAYFALDAQLMAEMAQAIDRKEESV